MKTAYRFRAYPSKEQKSILNHQMLLSKELYNFLLVKSKEYFKDTGKTFTKYDMNKWITKFKKEYLQYQEIHSQVLQNISDRLSKAYSNFFRRVKEKRNGKKQNVGFPRFRNFTSSLTFPQKGFKVEKKEVKLSKIGTINFVNHREIEGKIKTISIKKTRSQKWFVTISVIQEDKQFISNNKPQAGMDLGLREYATLSDNTKIANFRFGKQSESKNKKIQRRLSRKQKGSKNRRKASIKFARISEYITNRREDFAHKLSYNMVNSYSFISYEKLQIANMVKNHHLAKSINDVSWARFTGFLRYKAESAGCVVIDVPPGYTTQTCSECLNVQKVGKDETIYNCQKCGLQIGRDLNASKNILRIGLQKQLKKDTAGLAGIHASGDIVRPSHMKADFDESGTIRGGHDE